MRVCSSGTESNNGEAQITDSWWSSANGEIKQRRWSSLHLFVSSPFISGSSPVSPSSYHLPKTYSFSSLCFHLLLFHLLSVFLIRLFQAVGELANPDLGCCGKNGETSLDLKRRGNQCFRNRVFDDALRFYSKALRVAPPHAIDGDKNLLASLFLNRANVLHVS